MNNAEKVINVGCLTCRRVKDGYLWVIEKISEHPHWVLWVGLAYVAVRR